LVAFATQAASQARVGFTYALFRRVFPCRPETFSQLDAVERSQGSNPALTLPLLLRRKKPPLHWVLGFGPCSGFVSTFPLEFNTALVFDDTLRLRMPTDSPCLACLDFFRRKTFLLFTLLFRHFLLSDPPLCSPRLPSRTWSVCPSFHRPSNLFFFLYTKPGTDESRCPFSYFDDIDPTQRVSSNG